MDSSVFQRKFNLNKIISTSFWIQLVKVNPTDIFKTEGALATYGLNPKTKC